MSNAAKLEWAVREERATLLQERLDFPQREPEQARDPIARERLRAMPPELLAHADTLSAIESCTKARRVATLTSSLPLPIP